MDKIDRQRLSVLELRGNDFTTDRYGNAKLSDGFLELSDLPVGDYRVSIDEPGGQRAVVVRVTEGTSTRSHIVGSSRKLRTELLDEVQIASTKLAGGKLEIELEQASKFSRVHVFANTFRPEHGHLMLGMDRGGLGTTAQVQPRSYYVEGRSIGDEYQYLSLIHI